MAAILNSAGVYLGMHISLGFYNALNLGGVCCCLLVIACHLAEAGIGAALTSKQSWKAATASSLQVVLTSRFHTRYLKLFFFLANLLPPCESSNSPAEDRLTSREREPRSQEAAIRSC